MREGPVPLEVTPLVWVFLSVLSIVVLVTIVIGATFRLSAACSARLRSKDVPLGVGAGRFKDGPLQPPPPAGYSSYAEAVTAKGGSPKTGGGGGRSHKLSPEKMRNNPDIIQDTGIQMKNQS
jgi:hypothetical protein